MRGILPFALLVALTLPSVPSAAAQPPPVGVVPSRIEVEASAPASLLTPDGAPVEFPVLVRFVVPGPATGTVTLRMSAPNDDERWRILFAPDEFEIDLGTGLGASSERTVLGSARARGDAPAFATRTFPIVATTEGNHVVAGAEGSDELPLRADWRPGLHVVLQEPRIRVSPDAAGVGYAEVVNTGNADVAVESSVASAPAGCAGSVRNPAPRVVEPGGRLTVQVAIECRSARVHGHVTAQFNHALAGGGRTGEPVLAQWDAVVSLEGPAPARSYGDPPRTYSSPAGGLVGAVLALAATAAVTRRGR